MEQHYTLVNLTPHVLNLFNGDGQKIDICPSGMVARVATNTIEDGTVILNNMVRMRTCHKEYGEVIDLPDPKDGTIYCVSGYVAGCVWPDRKDVVKPADLICDDHGIIIGANSIEFCDGTRI